jgi:formylglycine-generating enzyme required for sulfatase activity
MGAPARFQNPFGMEFVMIPPGRFTMGDEKGFVDEQPAHVVEITRPFTLQSTAVTLKQWRMFVNASGYVTESERAGFTSLPAGLLSGTEGITRTANLSWRNPGFDQKEDHPVVCVTWADAQAFIEWLNQADPGRHYRLPTEAEWEYACKAGSPKFGKAGLNKIAWYYNNTRKSTHPVAQKSPNAWGLYDMLGNASQWCQDWYSAEYYVSMGMAVDPLGPPSGTHRVARGGGWYLFSNLVRPSYRNHDRATYQLNDMGFRLAANAQ